MSRERPQTKVFGLTPNHKVARQLALAWGIHSVITEDITSFSEMVTRAEEVATEEGHIQASQLIVVTAGIPFGRPGTTNTLKILRVGDT
jgi:pyruvate kinase